MHRGHAKRDGGGQGRFGQGLESVERRRVHLARATKARQIRLAFAKHVEQSFFYLAN
jgi:hypothetical protein